MHVYTCICIWMHNRILWICMHFYSHILWIFMNLHRWILWIYIHFYNRVPWICMQSYNHILEICIILHQWMNKWFIYKHLQRKPRETRVGSMGSEPEKITWTSFHCSSLPAVPPHKAETSIHKKLPQKTKVLLPTRIQKILSKACPMTAPKLIICSRECRHCQVHTLF